MSINPSPSNPVERKKQRRILIKNINDLAKEYRNEIYPLLKSLQELEDAKFLDATGLKVAFARACESLEKVGLSELPEAIKSYEVHEYLGNEMACGEYAAGELFNLAFQKNWGRFDEVYESVSTEVTDHEARGPQSLSAGVGFGISNHFGIRLHTMTTYLIFKRHCQLVGYYAERARNFADTAGESLSSLSNQTLWNWYGPERLPDRAIDALRIWKGGLKCGDIINEVALLGHDFFPVYTPKTMPCLTPICDALETNPAVANAAPKAKEGEPPANRPERMTLAEAEILVRKWLAANAKDNPARITRDAIAAGTGVSCGTVSETAPWKAFRAKRDAEKKPKGRTVQLTDAMQAVIPGKCEMPHELAALIEGQKAESDGETRRH